jgi:deoxyribodipyrimidine photolyase-related protein
MYDHLPPHTYTHIRKVYIPYKDVGTYSFLDAYTSITMYDPTDIPLLAKYKSICKKKNKPLDIIESENFIISTNDMHMYISQLNGKSPRHSTYYNFVKEKLGILKDVPNLDKYNRSPLDKSHMSHLEDHKPPRLHTKYYEEAIDYVETNFKDHLGTRETLQNLYMYPISTKQAYLHFDHFLQHKLPLFGKYQDAISEDHVVLYHSCISACLNIGLLSPRKLVALTMGYYEKHKSSHKIPLSSLEGFIRQLIGWREYMRMLYIHFRYDMVNSNLPQNTKHFTAIQAKQWYTGTTGLYPLDNEIKKAITTGYAHHIIRLMVFMNFMILSGLHPYVIYKWFMEVVSIDAYEWVMIPNIYAMGYFYKRAMTRPYLSKSTYIAKMSNYKKDGHWDVIWDDMFDKFVREKPREYVFWYN